jgi:hypothetical protein
VIAWIIWNVAAGYPERLDLAAGRLMVDVSLPVGGSDHGAVSHCPFCQDSHVRMAGGGVGGTVTTGCRAPVLVGGVWLVGG